MTYCIDIDGTLCTITHGKYESAVPFPAAIARVRAFYEAGHRIVLFTARGTTTGIDWRSLTEKQMKDWGVPYHQLILGKPEADVYIDDRAVSAHDWMSGKLESGVSSPRGGGP